MGLYTLINKKKGQVWGLDLIVASIIFLVGIIIFYVYMVNYPSQSRTQIEEFSYEGNLVAKLLLEEEYVGIVSDGKINQTKLDSFYNLNHNEQKNLLGVGNDFYFIMNGLEIEGNSVGYVGKINTSNADTLVKVTRLAAYNNKPVKFEVYVWR